MARKIGGIAGLVLLAGLVWYALIKPYDYRVTFEAKTQPGTINQTLKLWIDNTENSEFLGQQGLHDLEQRISFNDSLHTYTWNLTAINDSTTRVRVYAKDVNHSLMNKLTIPFSETDFEKRTKNTLKEFLAKLQEHLDSFKITISGEDKTTTTFCAYIPLKSTQFEKAAKMMQNYAILDGLIRNSQIRPNGTPFIEVTRWNMEQDSIEYNFCYPIIEMDSLPDHKLVKFKKTDGQKALKAIYNGNYITSDRAWYALLDEAKKRGLKTTGKPIEVFHSNPNMGNDQLQWKAEIFMPIDD